MIAVQGATTGTANAPAAAGSAVVAGFADCSPVTVSVAAVNALGSSPTATTAAIPRPAYPSLAPQQLQTAPTDTPGEVAVSWTAPQDDGGSSVSGYTITARQVISDRNGEWAPAPGSSPTTTTADAGATSTTLTGLSPANGVCSP